MMIALGRSGVRIARAGRFTLEVAVHLRRDFARDTVLTDLPQRASRLSWIAENLATLQGIVVQSSGPIPRSPVVAVANHLGYLDPIAIVSVLPCLPIAKKELGQWPLVGEMLQRLGVLLVDRDDAHDGARVLLRARRYLAAGVSVLAFPEGTTTLGHGVLPMRRGAFGLARRLGVPIVPIAIRYDSPEPCWVGDQHFLPHYVRTTARPLTRVQIRFGAPLELPTRADASALARAARGRILAMLGDRS